MSTVFKCLHSTGAQEGNIKGVSTNNKGVLRNSFKREEAKEKDKEICIHSTQGHT